MQQLQQEQCPREDEGQQGSAGESQPLEQPSGVQQPQQHGGHWDPSLYCYECNVRKWHFGEGAVPLATHVSLLCPNWPLMSAWQWKASPSGIHCPALQLWRWPRVRHCYKCRRCVDRFDHHCPAIRVCVGEWPNAEERCCLVWDPHCELEEFVILGMIRRLPKLGRSCQEHCFAAGRRNHPLFMLTLAMFIATEATFVIICRACGCF